MSLLFSTQTMHCSMCYVKVCKDIFLQFVW